MSTLQIRPLQPNQVDRLTDWARREGFAPGLGDVEIYRHTDRQGLWIGWLGSEPVGCIAGVKYNLEYGFIGLYIVVPEHRGQGYGRQLWQHALDHLAALPCVGLEAASDRIEDYAGWGFRPASPTTRWQRISQPMSQRMSGEAAELLGTDLRLAAHARNSEFQGAKALLKTHQTMGQGMDGLRQILGVAGDAEGDRIGCHDTTDVNEPMTTHPGASLKPRFLQT